MIRRSALRYPPKGFGGSLWETLQKKGMAEAGKHAQSYAKNFSKSKQGQDIYRQVGKTTAAVEAKVKGTFNHYWAAFHEVKSNIKTGPSASSSNTNTNTNNNSSNNSTNNSSSSSSDSSSNNTDSGAGAAGAAGAGRSFYQRAEDFWNANKDYIMSFIAANFMGVIFAIQFGGQIWSLCAGLWGVYWSNKQIKQKKAMEEERREGARRLAAEEREDALDDVYGGTTDSRSAHVMSHDDPSHQPLAEKGKLTRSASAVSAATDEEALQKRLARREERRRKKEMEDSGLVLHDEHYAKREEERQSSLFTGAPSSRKLEKEEVRAMSGMEMLATQLLKQEEDEHIDGSLSATDLKSEAERDRMQTQLFWKQQAAARNSKKVLTRRMKRKIRKAQRERELQAFFAQREAAAAGGLVVSSSSSSSNAAASGDAARRHAEDEKHNALAYADSFSYKVGDAEAVSFAAAHDSTHARYKSEGGGGVLGRLWGKKQEAVQSVFDFTSGSSQNASSSAAGGGAAVHDFTA